MIVYWLIFAIFAVGAISYASTISRFGLAGVAGPNVLPGGPRRSIVLPMAGILLLIIIGLRYRVGGDWANYLDVFRRMAPQDLGPALVGSRQEPGYTFVNWMVLRMGAGIWLVNLTCAVPFTYGLLRLCRQQPNPWLALLIATPFLIIVVGMGFTRQAAALGCLMVGIAKIIDKKPPVQFVLWTLAGSLFHRTVLVFIPVMFITGMKNKFLSYVLVVASLVIGYWTVLPSALDQYGPGYLRDQYNAAGANVRVAMDVLPAVVVLLTRDKFFWSPEEKSVWRTYAVLCVLAGAALPFIHSSVVIDRLAMYLIPMQIFVYSRIGYCFGLIRRGWMMWTTAVIIYSAAVLFVWLNYAVNAGSWIPYQNYLAAPERY